MSKLAPPTQSTNKPTTSTAGWNPHTKPDMSELLQFILAHEEAFQTRGRLASLYSDFRGQLDINAEGYYANLAAWKKALADGARAGLIPGQGNTRDLLNVRTGEELARVLQHPEFGKPTCLSAVMHDAVLKKEFIPLSEFLNAQTSIYKSSWIPSPLSVVKWGLRQVGVLGNPILTNKLGTGDFVVLSNVETASRKILEEMSSELSPTDRVLSRAAFLRRFERVLNQAAALTANDMNVLLTHLARDRQAISFNAQAIKFAPEGSAPTPIEQEDVAVAQLKDTIAKTNTEIDAITGRIATLDADLRQRLVSKQMIQAKAALRLKKMAESALEQRTKTVLQLEETYEKVQQAAGHVETIEALKASTTALKGLHAKVGGAEGVAKVVDALREQTGVADEINSIISENAGTTDETEIDEEFAELEKAENAKKEEEDAAKTAAKLSELEEVEKKRQEKEKEAQHDEPEIVRTSQDLASMSVEDDKAEEQGQKMMEGVVPA